jgi:ABC-type nitrate/sulfonate/bicarbonate transport system substrate-binding protein
MMSSIRPFLRRRLVASSVVLLCASIAISACGSSKKPAASAASSSSSGTSASGQSQPASSAATTKVDSTHVVIAWNSTPDEAYLPLLMAIDTLDKQGYKIEAKTLSGSDITFQGLATNQIQFTADSLPPGALSVSKGAPVRLIATRNANLVDWVSASDYTDCSKLNGKPVGIYSETGGYTVEMKLYFAKHCPSVKPQYITIPDSPVRAQAVATGKIFGTALGLPDAVALQAKYPDKKFNVVPLRQDLPGVGDEYVYTNESTIKNHEGIVEALLTEQLKAIRSIYQNPSSLDGLVKQYLQGVADANVAKQFVQQQIWYANGGLQGPGLANTLKAFSLPGSPDQLQDTAPLTAVIAKIGKSTATQY